jgi:hypothetical protein
MRKVAYLKNPVDSIVKLMLYQTAKGVNIFGYDDLSDGPAKWDIFIADLEGALEFCFDEYGLKNDNWIDIKDPA